MPVHEMSCVAHVHSTYSDGTATVPEVLAAARRSGADAVLLTDHDTLAARRDGWEGWHDGVLLVVGHEISPRGGHLLAFGPGGEIDHRGRSESACCAAVAARGGLAIAAHPFSRGSAISRRIGRAHPWPALDDPCLTGVELWSLETDVAEGWRGPRDVVRSLRSPERVLDGPPRRHLREYDALTRRRVLVGIGGLDAHQPGLRLRDRVWSVMPNERWFGMLRTHILLERPPDPEPRSAVTAVLDAVRRGSCFLARVDIADPRGFRFSAGRDDGARLRMGGQAPAGGWTLSVRAPRPAQLRVLRDGREHARADNASSLTAPADEPGAYRAEACVASAGRTRTWIVSNPVYLR
jgi:PHP domain-containing protein